MMVELIPIGASVLLVVAYLGGSARLRRRGTRWPLLRTLCLLAGAVCLTAAMVPPLAAADDRFPVHVAQHLMLAMLAPALLALSAPLTLALRTLPGPPRRLLLGVLHSRAVAILCWPPMVLLLDLGGMFAFYLAGWYERAEHDELLHAASHLHMVAAGCLLSWVVLAVDPVRRRPSLSTRLVTLVSAAAGHDILAKLLYAHQLPAGAGPTAERQAGAQLMYYGGTVMDVVLATVVMAQWYGAAGRRQAHDVRRAGAAQQLVGKGV